MKSFRQIIQGQAEAKRSNKTIKESLIGKGFSAVQNRQHQTLRTQALSKLSAIQSDCRLAIQEDDERKREEHLFHLIFDLAATLKLFAEMSTCTNNISAMAVFDQESLKRELAPVIKSITQKR
jgi:hypothetical protein